MIELTEEELRIARLWSGLLMCHGELNSRGFHVVLDLQNNKAFNEFACGELGRRVVGLDLPSEEWPAHMDWLKAMVSDPVREALGIKKL